MLGNYLYIKVLLIISTENDKCKALYVVFEMSCRLLIT